MEPTARLAVARVARWAALVVLWVVVAVKLVWDAGHSWDFHTYYYAASAVRHGLDPYHLADLARTAGTTAVLPFLYPPLALVPFLPFTWLPFRIAAGLWLGIEAIVLFALLQRWRRNFVPDLDPLLLSLIAVLAFDGATVWGLRSGNVDLIEALLLWTAFAAYAADRRGVFTTLVVVASLWKLAPAFFLFLLLVPSRRERARPALAALGLGAVVLTAFAPVVIGPEWTSGFLTAFPAERPWGRFNPSSLGVIDTLLGDHRSPVWGRPYVGAWWLAYLAPLLAVSWPALRGAWRARDPGRWVMIGVMLYALVVPRMMIYSYVLLVVPALVLGGPLVRRLGGPVAIGIAISAESLLALLGMRSHSVLAENMPFLLTLALWLAYAVAGDRRPPEPEGAP